MGPFGYTWVIELRQGGGNRVSVELLLMLTTPSLTQQTPPSQGDPIQMEDRAPLPLSMV